MIVRRQCEGLPEISRYFTNRDVRTTKFELDGEEFDFYDALTRYVEDQSIKAAAAENVQANILGFQMAMLQPKLGILDETDSGLLQREGRDELERRSGVGAPL